MDGGYTYLLIVLCLVILSVSMLRRSQNRSASVREAAREQYARLRDQSRMRETMEELLLQLEEVSRRINAQVDTRFSKLENAIRDADDRIAKLEKLRGDGGQVKSVSPSASPSSGATRGPAREPQDSQPPGRPSKAPQGAAPLQKDVTPPAKPTKPRPNEPEAGAISPEEFELGIPGVTRSAGPSPDTGASAPPPAEKAGDDGSTSPAVGAGRERRQRIYELADAGSAAITIADTLNMPLGEVELVLNLRRYGAGQ